MIQKNLVALLPHRGPGRMLETAHVTPDGHLEAHQHIPHQHPMLDGHFPGKPIWPGVLLIEAMAQTTALLLMELRGELAKGEIPILGSVDIRLLAPVFPGNDILFSTSLTKRIADKGLFTVVATRQGETVARGRISAGIVIDEEVGVSASTPAIRRES